MKDEFYKKIIKIIMDVVAVLIIAFFAYSITPKTFQNDTFYTIKIGEHLQNTVGSATGYLPWNNGIDLQDPFSFHKGLPYMYPHWLYDLLTYKVYCISGFYSVYTATCILAVILGLSIYLVNRKLNKNIVISLIVTLGAMFCFKDYIAARAQLVTFILFVFTIYGIEKFIQTKKLRYAMLLVIIPIIIANVHSAVWGFYFVFYLPYLGEYFVATLATTNYAIWLKKFKLSRKKKKITQSQYELELAEIKKEEEDHEKNVSEKLKGTYKLDVVRAKSTKWLIVIAIICAFTGLLTPIKDMPYTYTLRTMQGNTMQSISEHLPLTLMNNLKAATILALVLGILIFTRTKIKIRDFFMLFGLILLSFISQRQVSMLVLAGNFILARMICNLLSNFKAIKQLNVMQKMYIKLACITVIALFINLISADNCLEKKNHVYVDETSYPVGAADYIENNVIPEVGKENLRIYNDYNYGSYLLYRGIPVFIDSRCDLYTPEFNGKKDESGNFVGRDIFTDFLDISGLSCSYETKFREYNITHVVIPSNSKLNSLISKDSNYKLLYQDDYFVVYERGK